jgi:hypothetical protein
MKVMGDERLVFVGSWKWSSEREIGDDHTVVPRWAQGYDTPIFLTG